MKRLPGAIQYRRLRAPQQQGGRLLEPPLADQLTDLLESQPSLQTEVDLGGTPLSEVAAVARHDLRAAAERYIASPAAPPTLHQDARQPATADLSPAPGPLILGGHQPELFHPGVWFKNFVIARLAKESGGTALNLLIDNDLAHEAAVRVPSGKRSQPQLDAIRIDKPTDPVPHEERLVVDVQEFAAFAARVSAAIRPLGWTPVVEEIWPAACRPATSTLGERLAAARRSLEQSWGVRNLELPLSTVCNQPGFRYFLAHLLQRLPKFHEIYNRSLLRYRQVHRIRSQAHPVPQLQTNAAWLEAPFWVWTADAPRRRPLFARHSGRRIEISDGGTWRATLPIGAGDDLAAAMGEVALATAACKLRPRALTTTMFARLFLSDLFVHGIGGAKYDQLTDSIIEQFFGLPAPRYVVATATLKLPVAGNSGDCERLPELRQQLRRMEYHPENFVEPTAAAERWIAEKKRWIEHAPAKGSARERHLGIERANAALRTLLESRRAEVVQQQQRLATACRNERIWGSREFSFCLFPKETLRQSLLDF